MDILPENSNRIKQNLKESLGIETIPKLIVLDAKTGHFVTDSGKDRVLRLPVDVKVYDAEGHALINSWKSIVPTPVKNSKKTRTIR